MHLLSYFRRKSESRDESEASGGVELSVRQPRPGQELKALPQSASKTTARKTARRPDHRHDSKRTSNGSSGPLEAQGNCNQGPKLVPHSSALPATAAGSLAPEALLSRLSSKQWLRQSCSSTRLVLSTLLETAAVYSLQQQHVLQQLQRVVDSVSWEAACLHCMDALVIRALLDHYCPGVQLAPGDEWEQFQHRYPMQDNPMTCLPAHLVSTLAAAAHSCEGSGRDSNGAKGVLQLVARAVVLGEVLQLQQQQASRAQLLQLTAPPQSVGQPQQLKLQHDGEQQQLDVSAQLQQKLQAWAAAVISAAGENAPQHSVQHHPPQWGELLHVLSSLQQQVQGSSGDVQQQVQDPLKNPAAVTSAEVCAETGSSQQGGSVHELQHQHELLQKLCRTLPVLLQPTDLAATATDSMQLVVLARLAAATSRLWSPLLAAAGLHAAVQAAAAEPAAPAATTSSSDGGCIDDAGRAMAVPALQLAPPMQASLATRQSARQDAAVAIWQGVTSEQVVAALADETDGTDGTAPSEGISSSLRSPRSSWPDELLSPSPQLWPGDVESEDDAAAITREERTLRCWINSLLHRHAHSTPQHTTAAAADQQGQLLQTYSLDSRLGGGSNRSSLGQAFSRAGCADATTPPPVRAQSVGGGVPAPGVPTLSPLQLSARSSQPGSSSGGGVFRSSSAGAAAVAAHLNVAVPGSNAAAHSRSISADAVGGAADVDASLDGWAGEPAAPTTPTAAAAAAAAAGAGAGGSSGSNSSSRAAAVPAISSIHSLFGAELRSGVLLLQLLDLLQPGSIDWRAVNKPPFVSRTAQLKALENCQLALKVAQEELGLPLVSMSPRDIVLGRRKIILSLVYQLMRYNTMQLLESISAVHTEQQLGSHSRHSSTGGDSEPSTPVATAQPESAAADKRRALQQQQLSLPPTGLQAARQVGGRVNIRSSSKKQRRQLAITEQDILEWANTKLQQVKPLAGSDVGAEAPKVRSFKDPVLGSGVVLLQLLHVLSPDLVDPAYVTPGHTAEQRQSNAKYALSLADRMGCSLFLVWEDLVDPPQPRMVLVLLASLMAQDLQRQQQQQQGAFAAV